MKGVKVCGIGIVSAIGIGKEENLSNLKAESCGIAVNTLVETSVNVPVGAVRKSNTELKEILGISKDKSISRTALLGTLAAHEAIRDAQIPSGKRVGFISSTTVGGMDLSENFYKEFMADNRKGKLREIVGHACSASTEFIANYCNITGFTTTISTACSSAANAMIMGANMLKTGLLDYVVVGGVDSLCRFTINGFNSLMILDQELCRPLDKHRKGLNLGEGAGFLVLTQEESTAKNYCNLGGYANANDAFHQTATSEQGNGAYKAMQEALAMANISSSEIDYINLHGTGTENNDASEITAIKRVFGDHIPACSSTKGYTGHTLAAAAGIEAVYSVFALEHQLKYANLRFKEAIDQAVIPVQKVIEGEKVKAVLSNSFGFGGNCSSLIFVS